MAHSFTHFLKNILQNRKDSSLYCALIAIHIVLESLPISSSGHLRIINNALSKVRTKNPLSFSKETEYIMHIPTALIIAAYIVTSFFFKVHFTFSHISNWIIAALVADFITGTFHLLFPKFQALSIPAGFFLSACALLSIYGVTLGEKQEISFIQALILGLAQTLALQPGVSRLALTCSIALWLGIDPHVSILVSLLMELGLITVALLKSYSSLISLNSLIDCSSSLIIASSLFSYGLLHLVAFSLETKTIVYFGWYMLIVACISYYYREKKQDVTA